MSPPSVNNRGLPSSDHIIGHDNNSKYQPCYPCKNASSASASTSMEEDDEPNTITPPQPQLQEQAANVGDLMAKAKKAAASLWLILHAQNCRQPQGTCSHRGCDDTKLLLVHVKTCPAGPNFPCPSCTKGCNETRKLLAHYRRCKDLRLKQVGLGRRANGTQPDQSCLVCSLMARYAKNVADRHRSPGRSNNPASLLADALASTSGSSSCAKFNVEKGFASNFPTQEARNGVRKPGFVRTPSAQLMPPPPPRHSAVSSSNPGTSESWVESPPRPSMLMHSKIVKIAAITDPESKESLSDAAMLGKSVDSSVVPFPILRKSSKEVAFSDELVVPAPQRRVRAESYDERRVKFAATVTSRHYYTAPQEEHFMVPDPLSAKNTGRPRSVSCGNMEHNSRTPSNNFDTIAEGEEHEEVFEMN
mmetsp:Transcript_18871/g.30996  ORF Transcript_18871/g.30996 Transcript_18871/m.30996 type:complete len:418 (+) Transcript_18871:263-1516(+)